MAFTPEEIAQILEEFFATVGTRQYIGARYVPIFGRKDEQSIEWDNTKPYEPLTIVLYQGNSFTSRQYVPVGVEITNNEFWAITGNYNAQVEQYRRETQAVKEQADNLDAIIPSSDYSTDHTVSDAINDVATALPYRSELAPDGFDYEHPVKDYVDEQHDQLAGALPYRSELEPDGFDSDHNVKDYVDERDELLAEALPYRNELEPDGFDSDHNVKDYIDESVSDEHDAMIEYVNESVNRFAGGFVGFTHNSDGGNNRTSIIYTQDFECQQIIVPAVNNKTLNTNYLSDSCSMYRIGKFWYATFGGTYYYSEDLLNWYLGDTQFTNPYGFDCWAAKIAELKDGSLIFICSMIYDETSVQAYIGTTMYHVIAYRSVVQADPDSPSLTFGDIKYLNVCDAVDNTTSYIDPALVYNPVLDKYIFAVKNELQANVEVYSGANLQTLTLAFTTNRHAIEAPNLVFDNANVWLTYQRYRVGSTANAQFFGYTLPSRQSHYYCCASYGYGVATGCIEFETITQCASRHSTYIRCDTETMNQLIKLVGNVTYNKNGFTSSYYLTGNYTFRAKQDNGELGYSEDTLLYPSRLYNYIFDTSSPSNVKINALNNPYSVGAYRIMICNPTGTNRSVTLGSGFYNNGSTITIPPHGWAEVKGVYATAGMALILYPPATS